VKLFASLYHELFAKSYQSLFRQLFAALFGSLFELMYGWLQALSCLALNRQMLLPRRPVGRGVGGRIVVRNGRTTTYRQSHIAAGACARPARQSAGFYKLVH
jgi:hypothetical protein